MKNNSKILVSLFLISLPFLGFSQKHTFSVEGSYFFVVAESFQQKQVVPVGDIGFRRLISADKKHNLGLSINGNWGISIRDGKEHFNSVQLRFINSLYPLEECMVHPFFGISIAHRRYVSGGILYGASNGPIGSNTYRKTESSESVGPTLGTDIYFGENRRIFAKVQADYLFDLDNIYGVTGDALFIKFGIGLNLN